MQHFFHSEITNIGEKKKKSYAVLGKKKKKKAKFNAM